MLILSRQNDWFQIVPFFVVTLNWCLWGKFSETPITLSACDLQKPISFFNFKNHFFECLSDFAHFFAQNLKFANVCAIWLTFLQNWWMSLAFCSLLAWEGFWLTSGLHEIGECMRLFEYFSFWRLFMLYKIDECMSRFVYFSFWGLLMLSENDECMHRFAYFPFRWLLMLHGSHTFLRLLNFAASQ